MRVQYPPRSTRPIVDVASLYKKKNKINKDHFCLLNTFDIGFCTNPQRGLTKNSGVGCCFHLCGFYKNMDYGVEGFLDCLDWIDTIKGKYKSVIREIIKTIQNIEAGEMLK